MNECAAKGVVLQEIEEGAPEIPVPWRSGWSVRFAVGRPWVQSPIESYQKTLKMISTASLLGARHLREVVENKPASSFVVFLGKALNGTPPSLYGKQVIQTPRKWQLPSECGRPDKI